MVFFTCNHCGESLKKCSVEKHYNYRTCRNNAKNLSCIDCLKDFYGEDYSAHTSCISEEQKYSGKHFVPKKAKNTGKNKQEAWMNIIGSIIDNKEHQLDNRMQNAFKRLQSFENVPRKKPKFQNFVLSAMGMSREQSEKIWSILEQEQVKLKPATLEKTEMPINGGDVSTNELGSPTKQPAGLHQNKNKFKSGVDSQNNESVGRGTTKNKKRKKDESNTEINEIEHIVANDEPLETSVILEKQTNSAVTDETSFKESCINNNIKKKKSKKNKRALETGNINETQEKFVLNDEPKQKKMKNNVEANCEVINGNENHKVDERNKKNKKTIDSKNLTNQQDEDKNENNEPKKEICHEAKNSAVEGTNSVFSWKGAIENIVANKTGGVKLDKLKQKVFKLYLKERGITEVNDKKKNKLFKKFEKHLNDCPKVHIENEIVKLV